jgi:hypothetical protein
MLKAKLSSYYRKNALVMVFVYILTATVEELAKYKAVQGTSYRENEAGQPLFFSTRALSNNRNEVVNLTITPNGRVVADDLTKILSQEAKLEEYVLQERAKLMAKAAVGQGNAQEYLANATATRDIATEAEVEEVLNNAGIEVAQDVPA